METKEYKSIHEIISTIQNNGTELGRSFSIKIIENDMYVNNKYLLRNFTGSDLITLFQYTTRKHYDTSSINADWGNKVEIVLFR